jgi:diguanylate cyclase (GGDEF)-like protein
METSAARFGPRCLAAVLAAALGMGAVLVAPPAAAASEARELELRISDNPRQAMADAQQWLAEAARTNNRPLELKALRLKVLAHDQVEDDRGLTDAAARGLALARELHHPEAEAEFIAARAGGQAIAGRYPEALADYDEAMRLAVSHRLEDRAARINLGRGHLFLAMGRVPDALDALTLAHARYEKLGDRFGMSTTLSALASVYGRETATPADIEKAISYHQRAIELAQSYGGRFDRGTDLFNLGTLYLRLKQYDRARANIQASLAISQELKDPTGMAYAHYRLGDLELKQGRPRDALAFHDKAILEFSGGGDRALQFRTHLARAEALAALDRKREALEALETAASLAQQVASTRLDPQLHESAARIHGRFGEFDAAYRSLLALREAERRRDEAARTEHVSEQQARFELQQKEAENALLRARERESEARRLALVLALILSLVVLGVVAFLLAGYVRRHRAVASLALKDDLTGIANRRNILEYGRQLVRRAKKGGEGVCVAVIDLDHFKAVNDELGHAVGDNVLRAFAELAARQRRSQDRVGRLGGEEFLVVMPGADLTHVPSVFERLRRAFQELRIEGIPEGRAVTFSMGAAQMRGVADDLDSIMQRADSALYRAKQAGRDRFETG